MSRFEVRSNLVRGKPLVLVKNDVSYNANIAHCKVINSVHAMLRFVANEDTLAGAIIELIVVNFRNMRIDNAAERAQMSVVHLTIESSLIRSASNRRYRQVVAKV
jgi:hypothetical protein